MAEKLIPLMLRLPQLLHAAVKTLARQEHRSLNAQIITLLLEAMEARTRRQKPS